MSERDGAGALRGSVPRVLPQTGARPLLVVQHVPWEGPHAILDAFTGLPRVTRHPLSDGVPLPEPGEVRGAVFMGGPMSVNDTVGHPRLADELDWIARAHAGAVPILGVCLGAQLIARALGAEVHPGPEPEIGWDAIEVVAAGDPLLARLAPVSTVLHWHGEQFDLPRGATLLACSRRTPVQAFRHGSAWGLLFHAEADLRLLEAWLAEPVMLQEARTALGPDAEETLRAQAAGIAEPPGAALFRAFAGVCERR